MNAVLDRIRHRLEGRIELVSLRGSGAASFLFAENQGKAVELSWNGSAWWLQFWEPSHEENAPPVGERIVDSEDDASAAVAEWLFEVPKEYGPLSDEALTEIGRELFAELDAREKEDE